MTINIAVVGQPGSGKTLFMAWMAYKKWGTGSKLYSNFALRIPIHSLLGSVMSLTETKSISRRIVSRHDLNSAFGGWLFMDELPLWLDSRSSSSEKNTYVNGVLQKHRKRDLSMVYSAQDFNMIDVRLRDNTNYVIVPSIEYMLDGKRYVIKQDFFNPVDASRLLNDAFCVAYMFTRYDYERGLCNVVETFRFPIAEITKLYDTYEEVKQLETSNEGKGELFESETVKTIEKHFKTNVVLNNNSGNGMNDSLDMEFVANGVLNIVDNTTLICKNGKNYYLDMSKKKNLAKHKRIAKERKAEVSFLFACPKDSDILYMLPISALKGCKGSTVSIKKLLPMCSCVGGGAHGK
jgi:hypothetical protein